jgi:hypothetical protein
MMRGGPVFAKAKADQAASVPEATISGTFQRMSGLAYHGEPSSQLEMRSNGNFLRKVAASWQ